MSRYLLVLLFDRYGLVFSGPLSDEMKGLSFILVYGVSPRLLCLSRVRVPWDS
jgi:hypothetical protein